MTSNRHKDFTSGPRDKTPLTFTVEKEQFTARPAVPGAVMLDFAKYMDSDDASVVAEGLMDFFSVALVDEDIERFNDFIRDPDTAIEMSMLADIVGWLVEVYSERPTKQDALSRPTRSKSGPSSTTRRSKVDSISEN